MNYRDTQIEQYIRGRMSGKALEEFERKLTVDSELRRSVQVERAITETVRRDAAFASAGTTPTIPAALAAKVAATPAAGGLNIATGGGVVGTIFGTKIGIAVVSVVGVVGIVLGVLLIAPFFDKIEGVKAPDEVTIESVREPDQGKGIPYMDSTNQIGGGDAATSSPLSIPSTNSSITNENSVDREQETADSRKNVDGQHTQVAPSDTVGKSASQKMLDQLRREEKEREMPTVKSGSAEVEMEIE